MVIQQFMNELTDKQAELQRIHKLENEHLEVQVLYEQSNIQLKQAKQLREEITHKLNKQRKFGWYYQFSSLFTSNGRTNEELQQELLKLDEHCNELQIRQKNYMNELDRLTTSIRASSKKSIEKEIEWIHLEMKNKLSKQESEEAHHLLKRLQQRDQIEAYIHQLKDVHIASIHAEKALESAKKQLQKSLGYSTWDTLYDSVLSTAIKREKLKESLASVQDAEWYFQQFQIKFKQIEKARSEIMGVTSSKWGTFADYALDHFLVDLVIHFKMKELKASVDHVTNEVIYYQNEIKKQIVQAEQSLYETTINIENTYKQMAT